MVLAKKSGQLAQQPQCFRYQLKNGSSYAVKRFQKKSQSTAQEDYLSSVRNEVDISTYLNHERIMPILDFFEEHGVFYSVMPYIPITLFDRTMENDTALLEKERDCIFRQIVDVLVYMHDKGVAHLDLKIKNILLENENEIKVIDFGNSQIFWPIYGASVKVEMILRNLPERARSVIGGMLLPNPRDRISMSEALTDDWIRSLHNCEMMQQSDYLR
ncbi:hypothetical protein POX_u09926 [Penicillium oxalicum]|uniref:uncharacterized protein n=1 Tax=Penicillium oxalicum TaxID=69781 RepID=UPI00215253D4|nr:uncharacterized protein POX_u09926 [Penicillium oxalicum]KAI2785611.1 hypothetical protein POX_u09926 [Penicillium oxalicum]